MTTNFSPRRLQKTGKLHLSVGVPNWLGSVDRAVINDGQFLSTSDAVWEEIEGYLGVDALHITVPPKTSILTIYRFGTGLGNSNFSCGGIRESDTKEEIDVRWRFVVQDYLVLVFVSDRVFRGEVEVAIVPNI